MILWLYWCQYITEYARWTLQEKVYRRRSKTLRCRTIFHSEFLCGEDCKGIAFWRRPQAVRGPKVQGESANLSGKRTEMILSSHSQRMFGFYICLEHTFHWHFRICFGLTKILQRTGGRLSKDWSLFNSNSLTFILKKEREKNCRLYMILSQAR